jgi:hypothetical protein
MTFSERSIYSLHSFVHSFIHSLKDLQPFVGHWPLFQFLNLYTVGRTPWTSDKPVARPLPTHRTTQTQNKRTQTCMPRVVFEPTIPVFERAKTVRALDRAATVIGILQLYRTMTTCSPTVPRTPQVYQSSPYTKKTVFACLINI